MLTDLRRQASTFPEGYHYSQPRALQCAATQRRRARQMRLEGASHRQVVRMLAQSQGWLAEALLS